VWRSKAFPERPARGCHRARAAGHRREPRHEAKRKRNPLTDPRVSIITNDARGALNLTQRRHDAIVSQPSHPWAAGASHLYTLEFMRQARAHLNDGGVFAQWMNVTFVDEALLRSLSATLLAVFEHVRIYRPDPSTLIFLASSAPLEVEAALSSSGVAAHLFTPPLRPNRHLRRGGCRRRACGR
jgi:hypothetical protein